MGSAFTPGGNRDGVIPNVMHTLFDRMAGAPAGTAVTLRVGFVEIHQVAAAQHPQLHSTATWPFMSKALVQHGSTCTTEPYRLRQSEP